MSDRLIDTYRWSPCRFDLGAMLLIKIAQMETAAQAMPHSEGWGNLNDEGEPPIEFIRSMQGATFLDKMNAFLEEATAIEDLQELLVELA